MRYSPEALNAFVEAVSCGSFSAAARRLRKSQSTISTAISNLEADLGVTLFDRTSRQPVLTEQGRRVLSYVQAILTASDRLDELAAALSGTTEARLTFVLSDTMHPDLLAGLLSEFDKRFPQTEFECLVGEDVDVIDLLEKGRAQIGLIEARGRYPTEIGMTRMSSHSKMAIYVAPEHPLAEKTEVEWDELHTWRELRLNTYLEEDPQPARGPVWSAPNYLLLLSMAEQGFGWCALPCPLVEEFAHSKSLVMLNIIGWPRSVSVDLVWNKKFPLGAAGSWLRDYLQNAAVPHVAK
ncbi:LysR family transcriptional regulator [Yokenella regensburgei]|jgi:DNA-binding transcriptional LysR family regulator|uniref:DNA-binding transcriptional LysR family regulator n=1 Tax=Yokenella regensburgei TaxID=158877 RepID=A0AB38G1F3_9ENTR|nr:LysR family transcriptional regulator [Yokenella regensburgei]EHM49138.1 LysR substrate binding domain protein [Yokenella regensburgei ATCC 43003]KFD23238.1 LysR family transcriptional regulator [Yokenella regensburgei ATCC 49455]MDQ4430458.1 LysR family transcriptional regulator [Yokenella regensburgei]MDR2216778.1 LysR family transcriptional regulator [Yokenella regensburgei]QIU90308.1 LysR family transcriptional regulator [Yokenella regensburgei]